MEAGFNKIARNVKGNCSTLDANFSPSKRKRSKMGGVNHKKRQLIITGSSPYLEYLPDMMKKKEAAARKSTMPVHTQPNATISNLSRKVLWYSYPFLNSILNIFWKNNHFYSFLNWSYYFSLISPDYCYESLITSLMDFESNSSSLFNCNSLWLLKSKRMLETNYSSS